jgi:hypothetical protein
MIMSLIRHFLFISWRSCLASKFALFAFLVFFLGSPSFSFGQGTIPSLSASAPISKPSVTLSEMKSRLPTSIPPSQSSGTTVQIKQATQTKTENPSPPQENQESAKTSEPSVPTQNEQDSPITSDPSDEQAADESQTTPEPVVPTPVDEEPPKSTEPKAATKDEDNAKVLLEERIRSLESNLQEKDTLIQALQAERTRVDATNQSLQSEYTELQGIMIALGDDRRARLEDTESSTLGSRVPHTKGWYYLEDRGWMWTAPSVFPMIFSTERGGWLYYEVGTHAPWIVYDYQQQTWEKW